MPSVLNADALTTLSNAKEMLGIASADTSNDNKVERLINRATTWIESETDRKLKARKYNNGASTHSTTGVTDEDYIYFSGSTKDKGGDTIIDQGYGVFYLPQFPVQLNSVLTFALDVLSDRSGGTESWDTTACVENDDFYIDRQNGVLRLLGSVFASGYRNYRITCAAGFQTGSAQPYVPGDLEELCIEVMKKLYRGNEGLQSESLGTWSRTYNVEQSQSFINSVIARYRRITL